MNRDKLGILLSFSCVIHCLALPIVAVAIPAVAPFADSEIAHLAFFILIFATTGWVFFTGKKSRPIVTCGAIGLFLIGFALAFEGQPIEKFITSGGSVFLIFGHFLNIRSRKQVHNSCSASGYQKV